LASISYKDAGVDIDAGDALVERIKPLAKATLRPEVLTGIGGFGAVIEIAKKYREPVLISGTDGVGTKLKLAFMLDKHDTVGIDLVAMSVNDILVQGAEPLFFLDYFATGKLDLDTAEAVDPRHSPTAASRTGCALIGGETAETDPSMYPDGEYDLAGFAVGVAEKSRLIDGSSIQPGDAVLGLASSGCHSNGYSLVRKLVEVSGADLKSDFHGRPFGEVLMAPTRIYVKPLLALMEKLPVKGMAHITGGGLTGNIPRVLPDDCAAELSRSAWNWGPLFDWLQMNAQINNTEMYQTFNCGIGMVVVVAPEHAEAAVAQLEADGETVWRIGEVVARSENGDQVVIK